MNIKELRKKKKLMQRQVAEQLGITLRYYQRIESSERLLSDSTYKTVEGLAKILGVTPEVLVKAQKGETGHEPS